MPTKKNKSMNTKTSKLPVLQHSKNIMETWSNQYMPAFGLDGKLCRPARRQSLQPNYKQTAGPHTSNAGGVQRAASASHPNEMLALSLGVRLRWLTGPPGLPTQIKCSHFSWVGSSGGGPCRHNLIWVWSTGDRRAVGASHPNKMPAFYLGGQLRRESRPPELPTQTKRWHLIWVGSSGGRWAPERPTGPVNRRGFPPK